MGFMGFGMQKWIYSMQPRKPFSMQRKGSFTVVPTYSRNFKLQYSKNKSGYNFGIILFLVLVLVVGFTIPHWLTQARVHHKQEVALRIANDNIAFNFLMTSGKRRLKKQNFEGSFSEFKLAQAIYPNDKEVNQLLLEVVSALCKNHKKYCEEFENLNF